MSTITLCKLGANVEACKNGEEGIDQICKSLSDGIEGYANSLPYDYIFKKINKYYKKKTLHTTNDKCLQLTRIV